MTILGPRAGLNLVAPVAARFADLESRVDLREVDLAAGQGWADWHRVEKALWTSGDLAGLVPVADLLAADEVVTDQITGEAEVFSHLDPVGPPDARRPRGVRHCRPDAAALAGAGRRRPG
ncbi:MAG: hypothetical protein WKF50_00485 [Nocardioides sp.]